MSTRSAASAARNSSGRCSVGLRRQPPVEPSRRRRAAARSSSTSCCELALDYRLALRLPNADVEDDAGFPFRRLAAEDGIEVPDRVVVVRGSGQHDVARDRRCARRRRNRDRATTGGRQRRTASPDRRRRRSRRSPRRAVRRRVRRRARGAGRAAHRVARPARHYNGHERRYWLTRGRRRGSAPLWVPRARPAPRR